MRRPALDPGELVFNARWAAATKLDLDAGTIATWDRGLVRDSRLLVPIDVQALFVPEGGDEPMVRLPSALNAPDGQGPGFPPPFTAGTSRARPASTSSGRPPTPSCGAGWTSRRTATGWGSPPCPTAGSSSGS